MQSKVGNTKIICKQKGFRLSPLVNVLALLGVCFSALPLPAYAYYPYNRGASWFWGSAFGFPYYRGGRYNFPLYLANSLAFPYYRWTGYNAPYYLLNSLVWNATYAISQGISSRRNNAAYERYYDRDFYESDFLYDRRWRAYDPYFRGVYTPNVYTNYYPNNDIYRQTQAMPPLAPQVAPASLSLPANQLDNKPDNLDSKIYSANSPAQAKDSPFLQGFVELVNSKYQGNIAKALEDAGTRSYAKALGLIDQDNTFRASLSGESLLLIRKILNDSSVDATSKINAVRLLLRHGSN